MALASRSRIADENTLPGKMPMAGIQEAKGGSNGIQVIGKSTGGHRSQQSLTSERRVLSDIGNIKAPARTPKPSPKRAFTVQVDNIFKSENLPPKAGYSQSSQKARARNPLRNIVNDSVSAPASKENTAEVVQQKPKLKSGAPKRLGSKATARIQLTDEQLRLADEWAKEDIHLERIHFSGDDMEALREKMIEAEIEDTVALVRNYRAGPVRSTTGKPPEDNVEDSLRYADGRLKLDTGFDEPSCSVIDSFDYLNTETGSQVEDPILNASTNARIMEDYPTIPENWSLREDCMAASP